MTEICFDGISTNEWDAAPARPAKASPYAKIIGIGIAAALSTTAIFTLMHRDAFLQSSWGGFLAGAFDKSAYRQVEAAADPAPAAAARQRRVAGVAMAPAWLPEGLSSVDIERGARPGNRIAARRMPAGMHEARVVRSTRLALAEPAPSAELIRGLAAATPVPAAEPAARPVQTAELESEPIALPSTPPLPAMAPLPKSVPQDLKAAAPMPRPEPAHDLAATMPAVRPTPAMPKTPPALPETPSSPAERQIAEAVPLPALRPERPAPGGIAVEPAPKPAPMVAEAEPSDGTSPPSAAPTPARRPQRAVSRQRRAHGPAQAPYALAYASPATVQSDAGSGGFLGRLFGSHGSSSPNLPGRGSGIAVYSIKDATVYMPNGQKLEAHSGTGRMTDDPRYIDVKMHGPTPPNVYNLTMREHLFHGVEAVRMLPTDRSAMHGRDGMLAHTYMLRGRPGQSNGCVVFKNYKKFLTAFKDGRVTKMIVVPTLADLPEEMASL